jgi:hypothetical protein
MRPLRGDSNFQNLRQADDVTPDFKSKLNSIEGELAKVIRNDH